MPNQKGFVPILILVIVCLIITAAGGYIYSKRQTAKSPQIIQNQTPSNNLSNTPTPTPTQTSSTLPTPAIPASSINGTLKQLSGDLQLMSDIGFPVTYYEAGTFTSGKYSGYKRVVAVYHEVIPGGTSCGYSVFLTNNDVSYIGNVDSSSSNSNSYNKSKVTQTTAIDDSTPSNIQLDSNFSLYNYSWLSFKNPDSTPPDCTLNSPSDKNTTLLSSSADYNIYFVT